MRDDGGTNAFVNQGDAEFLSSVTVNEGVAVSNSGDMQVEDSLWLQAGGSSSGALEITAGALVTISDTFTMQPGATLSGDGELRMQGTLNLLTPVEVVGTLSLKTNGEIVGSGDLTFADGSDFVWDMGTMSGSGTTFIASGATLTTPEGFTKELRRDLVNNGTIEWLDGPIDLQDATLTNLPDGVINLDASPSVFPQFRDDGGANLFDNQGVFNVGSSASIRDGVALSNVGLIEVEQGTFLIEGGGSNGGTLVAGVAGVVEQDPGFTLDGDGTATVRLGGTTPGTDHGQHQVNGTAFLAGTLTIELAKGYTPTLGDTFDVVTYGALGTQFDAIQGLDIGGGQVLEAAYLGSALRLTVVSAIGESSR